MLRFPAFCARLIRSASAQAGMSIDQFLMRPLSPIWQSSLHVGSMSIVSIFLMLSGVVCFIVQSSELLLI